MGNSGSAPATPASTTTTTTTTTTPTTTTTTTTTEPPTTTTALTETPLTTSAITMNTVKEICRIEVLHLVLAFFAGVLLSTLLFVLIFYIRKKIRGPDVIKVSKALQSPDVSQKMASNEIEEGLTYARLNFQQNSESQKHASDRSRQLEIDAPSKSKEDTYASVSIKN